MTFPTFTLGQGRRGSQAPATPARRPLELHRVSMARMGGREVYVFSRGETHVYAQATPGLRQALSGIQLGQQTISDQNTANNILQQIMTMNQQVQDAQTTADSNVTAPSRLNLQTLIGRWQQLRDSYAADIGSLSEAAQTVLQGGSPQSVTDQQMAELNSLVTAASNINQLAAQVQAEGASGQTTGGGSAAGATPSGGAGLPGTAGAGPGTAAAPGTTAPSDMGSFLGLPWWEWLLFGAGGLGLLVLLSPKGR